MGILVSVSGVDCAGKSTQIAALQSGLARRGLVVRTYWHRPGYSKLLDRLRRWLRRATPGALPAPNDAAGRARVFGRPWIRVAWASMALLDAMIHYAVVLRLARVRCGAVICDRYWRDGLLDLTLRFPDLAVDRWLLARCVSRLVPRPDVAILLSIPYEEMIGRMGEKAEPFPDPPQVRDRRYAEYMRWAASGEVSVVEAGEVREKVAETVMSLVRGVGR